MAFRARSGTLLVRRYVEPAVSPTLRTGNGKLIPVSLRQVQILLFATLAIELKRRAPNAHTFLEVIRARYGTYAHITFMVFGLLTNILYASDARKQLLC